MASKEARILWVHVQCTALLLLSELAVKGLLYWGGAFFLTGKALAVVDSALTWFTVGTIVLFVVSCFCTLGFLFAESLIKSQAALKRTWRHSGTGPTAAKIASAATTPSTDPSETAAPAKTSEVSS